MHIGISALISKHIQEWLLSTMLRVNRHDSRQIQKRVRVQRRKTNRETIVVNNLINKCKKMATYSKVRDVITSFAYKQMLEKECQS